MSASRRALLLLAAALTCTSAFAQRPATGTMYGPNMQAPGGIEPVSTLTHKDEVPVEKPVVTHHTITLHGKPLAYTATTGRMPIKTSAGVTDAEMFYVAYTADNASAKRPLTFVFNGGPGSATIWLHMGAFGPRKVKALPDGGMPPPPFETVDNEQTWLDQTDLVFIDAIGTGYSRALSPEAGKKYWGLLGDLDAFGEFIRVYLQENSRYHSPLYLAGESYGTTRAAGLSGWLIDHGIALNGITMISTVLNFQTTGFAVGNDLPYLSYLPTYALTAAYHHKLAPELNANLPSLKDEVMKWCNDEYSVILQKGDSLTPAERQSAIDHLARYTGLSKTFIANSNLRIDLPHFDAELLREEGKTVGRLDGRFTGTNASGTQQSPDFDASEAVIRPPYTSVFGDYVKKELGYDTDLVYWVLGGGIGPWAYPGDGRGGFPDVSQMLLRAFAKNPYMHLFVAEGYYDAATPIGGVEYTLNHMNLTPEMHKNISRDTFAAGHMVYIDTPSIIKLKKDIDNLYSQTAPK
jgi:carboxypeptidase C (cathepsin A)